MTKRSAKDLANELEDLMAYDLGMKIVEKYEKTMLSLLETLQESNAPPSLAMKVIAGSVATIL